MFFSRSVSNITESLCFYLHKYFSFSENKDTWAALIISFCITFFGIFISLEKISAISKLKAEIINLQKNLNSIDWDIAYRHIRFNTLFFSPVMEVKNLSIYHKTNGIALTIPEFSVKAAPFSFSKYNLFLGEHLVFSVADKNWPITISHAELEVSVKDKKIEQWLVNLDDNEIKNFGKIQSINIAGRKSSGTLAINGPETIFENHIDIQNILLNPKLKHPLGNKIERLYVKTDTMKNTTDEKQPQSLNEWRQQGGYINISNLIINWSPFSLVGKGELNIDKQNAPQIQLETSSQGLLSLLNNMQETGLAERKNIFVANILLTNKAFKLKENDSELTIVTPINYQDRNLLIENISIGKF